MAKRIAYFGPAGTFTQEAAIRYDSRAQLVPFPTIRAVALAVTSGMAEEGVVPIENSLEGSVNETLDLLIREERLFIRHELVMPIEHCLMVKGEVNTSEIQVIYSHPQSLAQCRGFLERCFPKAQLVASLSNAAAVQDMKNSSAPTAAIAPARAAEIYGAQILARGIQDNPSNRTRFVVLAPSDHPPTGRDKTSLCFYFAENRPGLLYHAMEVFAKRNLNLAKIESRPTREVLGEYIFLLDVEGHREDRDLKGALEELRSQASTVKVFGSYPRWVEPNKG